jgi:putative IMPACT (imprinted ancient) family translation regulator
MLSVLLNSGVGEIVVGVTRYFGGVKLGRGGLVRAYTGAVQHALRELATSERVATRELRAVVAYAHADAARRAVERAGGSVVDEVFAADVTLIARVPEDAGAELERALLDATAGGARVEWTNAS